MKKKEVFCGIFLVISLLFSSCTKEEEPSPLKDDKAYLSFQALLNDLSQKQQNKQMTSDIPECNSGTPAFVDIVLTHEDVYIMGSDTTPFRLNLNPNASDTDGDGTPDYFTEESAILELMPGTYTLEYFTVLDEDENVIWIAPINDDAPGGIDDMVTHSLPMDINLDAGVKKYQDVEVVCFDDRIVNEYGYLFYDLNGVRLIEFCIFGNYCDETGRHAEFIQYKVDVWKFSGDALAPKGEILHEDLENSVVITDYEDYSETNSYPVCLTLPDGPGFDEYYVEITHIYTGTEDVVIRSGLISDADVTGLFNDDGTLEYYHFREGNCNMDDEPILLSDHRDILNDKWEFTFNFGDAMLAADVIFYTDGTASFQIYGNPNETIWGTWAYYDNYLFYDPDGPSDVLGYGNLIGEFVDDRFSGDFWYDGAKDTWSAYKKN